MEDIRKMGIVELRPILGDRVDAAFYQREPTIITKNDKPRAVLASYDQWSAERAELAAYRAKYGTLTA
jgi:PHD/YefM family antitoxin component YafN of YafNO toxin-antitoxin module